MNGKLYGTTYIGGKDDFGTVFEVSTSGAERVIYSFKGGADGTNPGAGLIAVHGKLYGTTVDSGAASQGNGTVFDVTTSGEEHVLHTFKGYPHDGESPYSPLIAVRGELYGTTKNGGKDRYGTVFEINTSGKERVLYSFQGPPDGASPLGSLLLVKNLFYGTTYGGDGTVFKVSLSGKESVVHAFTGPPTDGSSPASGLTLMHGKLYGTTYDGGANDYGAIFDTTTSGKEALLYSFKGAPKGGANPFGILINLSGALYGTTVNGGINTGGQNHPDGGIVFRLVP